MRHAIIIATIALLGCHVDPSPFEGGTSGDTSTGIGTGTAGTDAPAEQTTCDIGASDSTGAEQEDHVTFVMTLPNGFGCTTYEALAYVSCNPEDVACFAGIAYFGDLIMCQEDATSIAVDV
jgi:hypothetical protein